MKRKLYKIVFLSLILFGITAQAQENREKRAEKDVEKYAYIDAIKIYERIAKKGYETPELLMNLGDSYYFNGKLNDAYIWYHKLFNNNSESNQILSEYYYRYAQTLKSIGDYEAADKVLEKFKSKNISDSRGVLFEANKNYLEDIKEVSNSSKVSPLSINTKYSDYGSTVYNNQLIFTSARDTGIASKKVHRWTGEAFTSLYTAAIDKDGNISKPKKFANELKKKYNQSSAVFSKDGNTMYFTSNNMLKGKFKKNVKGTTLLKIYKATLVNGKWNNIVELPFNSKDFNTAHPALTADGKWLYFSSDREGGFGKSDLYKVAILDDNSYGTPVNLGEVVNTEGRETFPFITENNELYFSTDARPGLGGLDIYVVDINKKGNLENIKNIGAPVNSPYDDFAFYLNPKTQSGYFSSNRDSKTGDDIYHITEFEKPVEEVCQQNIHGVIYDKKTTDILVGATVILYDNDFNEITHIPTDAEGKFVFTNLDCGVKYRINVSKPDYNTAEVTVNLSKNSGTTKVDFGLEKTRIIVKKGDDLFKVLKLKSIYFDYDKADIRPDAAIELQKVVEVLREYPKMKIDVRSHTDSRGKDSYNLKLSDRRAKATVNWIINQGIDKSNIQGKGYGETRLINRCTNGVKCSDEEHQENRRSEFIVLELQIDK